MKSRSFLPNAPAASRDQPVTSAFIERATFARIRSDAPSLHGSTELGHDSDGITQI